MGVWHPAGISGPIPRDNARMRAVQSQRRYVEATVHLATPNQGPPQPAISGSSALKVHLASPPILLSTVSEALCKDPMIGRTPWYAHGVAPLGRQSQSRASKRAVWRGKPTMQLQQSKEQIILLAYRMHKDGIMLCAEWNHVVCYLVSNASRDTCLTMRRVTPRELQLMLGLIRSL